MSGQKLITERKRTHRCGTLRAEHIGQEVVVMGWVQTYRDLGGAVFIDLRDRTGLVQVVFDAGVDEAIHAAADKVRNEWVIGVVGKVRSRGTNVNSKMPTGEIEILGAEIEIFNKAETPPFAIDDDVDTAEEKRLSHRYLDLRRPKIQQNLMLRSRLNHVVRRTLHELDFLELETPFMVKYTPGGARNFLVPSRLNPGNFYALAESPQLYKQLFMMAGFDRYFQITKCFRDEDLRQDRQPEFTQIDLEMSFADMDDVHQVMEKVIGNMFQEGIGVSLPAKFPKMSYDEAMRRFGSDKPDLRFGLEHVVLTEVVKAHPNGGLPLFEQAVAQGGMVKAMVVPAAHQLSRTEVDKLEPEAKGVGALGLGRAKIAEGGSWTQSPFAKTVSDGLRQAINEATGAKDGDIVLFQFGPAKLVHTVMNHLRLLLGKKLNLIPANQWAILWVVEFPLFEHDEKTNTYAAAHHPFTSPRPEDVDRLTTDPGACRAKAYDLVLNGNEIAGGSVRIHDPNVQQKVFQALGISPEEQRAKFGFLLDALAYGAPPHAGIAGGMDRISMLLTGATSLRDVIPFPKTQRGQDLMTSAPTPVSDRQLEELFIKSTPPKA
ncbi:MAG: aspartate--tRNA ligase [Deltaproteobacteria bacterium]|jgi:aspartyl-tRNA synthetase|nr:aspartate--tRNA ligase [Deltaproteobacteria bacterium]